MATPCRMGCCGLSLDVTFGNRVPWKAPCKPYSGDKFVSGPDPLALCLRLPSLCRLALWVGWSGWVLGVTPLEWWVPFKISVLHSFQPQKGLCCRDWARCSAGCSVAQTPFFSLLSVKKAFPSCCFRIAKSHVAIWPLCFVSTWDLALYPELSCLNAMQSKHFCF